MQRGCEEVATKKVIRRASFVRSLNAHSPGRPRFAPPLPPIH